MAIERLNPPGMRQSTSLSQAVRVGDTVYISGQSATDADYRPVGIGDADAQAAQIFSSLKTLVEAAGGSMYDLVKITAYLTRPEYTEAIARARELYLPIRDGARPAASTTVVVPALVAPNALMEVEAVAVIGDTGKSHVTIDPPKLPKGSGHPHGAKAGNAVYVTGIMSRRYRQILGKGDAELQGRLVFDQMDYVLESVGATRADVVRHQTFYTHPDYYQPLRRVHQDVYGTTLPAGSAISVLGTGGGPDPVVEIEATAILGEKKHLYPDNLPDVDGFTPIVIADGMAYISGQVAIDMDGAVVGKGDIDAQLAKVYAHLETALKACGGSKRSMIKTTTYMTRPEYFANIRRAREEFYGADVPANTGVIVRGLTRPDSLVEIEGIAALD